MNKPLVEIRDLRMLFKLTSGGFRRKTRVVKAVDDVSFDILAGETLAVVGESGCGKSTITRALLRIYEPTAGAMTYHGEDGPVDLATLSEKQLAPYRQDIRLVFQDPQGSLNPRLPVMDIIGEVLKVNGLASGKNLREKVAELMRRVGLRPETMHRYPHTFSGGERQRIGIARALACNPKLLIADEAVSALDVSVQAQTINLLKDLQAEFGLTYLFVSHDLSVVQHISDRIAVMYVGNLVEIASTDDMFARPLHPPRRCFPQSRFPIPTCATVLPASGCRARWPTRPTCRPAARSTRAAASPRCFAPVKNPRWPPRQTAAARWPVTMPMNSNSQASSTPCATLPEGNNMARLIRSQDTGNQPIVGSDDETLSLISFRLLRLAAGETFTLAADDSEHCFVPMSGVVDIITSGQNFASVGGRDDIFAGVADSVYVPVGHVVTLSARSKVEIAVGRKTGAMRSLSNPVSTGPRSSCAACGASATNTPSMTAGSTARCCSTWRPIRASCAIWRWNGVTLGCWRRIASDCSTGAGRPAIHLRGIPRMTPGR